MSLILATDGALTVPEQVIEFAKIEINEKVVFLCPIF